MRDDDRDDTFDDDVRPARSTDWDTHNETLSYAMPARSVELSPHDDGADPWGGAQNRTQRLGTQRLGTQRLGTQRLGTQGSGTQGLGTQGSGTQGLGTERLSTVVVVPHRSLRDQLAASLEQVQLDPDLDAELEQSVHDAWSSPINRTQAYGTPEPAPTSSARRTETPAPAAAATAWEMAPPAGVSVEVARPPRSQRRRVDEVVWRSWSLAPPAGVDEG